MSVQDDISRVLGQMKREGRHVYLITLQGRTVRVRADFHSIDTNGVLSFGLVSGGVFLAYAPGVWEGVVREGIEVERL